MLQIFYRNKFISLVLVMLAATPLIHTYCNIRCNVKYQPFFNVSGLKFSESAIRYDL